jgi:hypothetical protein
MAYYNITTSNTSFMTEGEPLIYAGKNGFTTEIGTIPILCNSIVSNVDSVILTFSNLNLLTDPNFNANVLDVPALVGSSNVYIKVPITQYAASVSQEGSAGYYSRNSYTSLEISSYNIQSNTITAYNKPLSSGLLSDLILPTPFYSIINQTILANNFTANTLFVAGSFLSTLKSANVSSIVDYTTTLKNPAKYKNAIRIFIDDIAHTDFFWDALDPSFITVPIPSGSSQIDIYLDEYVNPAIESNDKVTFSTYNNNYTIYNTSYSINDPGYNEDMYNSQLYTITLDRPIPSDTLSYYIINTSQDLEGTAGNITSNSFSLDYDNSYPYSYNLANTGVYYLYQKNRIKYAAARPNEYGLVSGLSPKNYIVEATNINRYNRTSQPIKKLLSITDIKLSKVTNVDISESIFIDTTGGASISATIQFPPLIGRDVTAYEILYRIISDTTTTVPAFTRVLINQDTSQEYLRYTINNLNRGPAAGYNTLEVVIIPTNGDIKGYPNITRHPLLGKLSTPAPLFDFYVAQQQDSIVYTWQFAQTTDGYILDLDTKEVEIREYPGTFDISDEDSVNAIWNISLPINRIPFPNTTYTAPISRYGVQTYLIRVRDTSNIESNIVRAATVTLTRVLSRVYKAYNEADAATPFIIQDNQNFSNSNTNPEEKWTSFSEGINGGLVLFNSSNTDNSNGSSIGFSVTLDDPDTLSTYAQSRAEYITQIRDMGQVVRGTIRINPIITISSVFTYNDQYRTVVAGITDFHESTGMSVNSSVLVDNAFGGIGHILGYNNAAAAIANYSSYAKTLTSGGQSGNVYAIRNPGQFDGDEANANTFAFIAGVINANAIQLGEVFYANGRSTGSNAFPNVAIAGNSYQLVDLAQFIDSQGSLTYLGPDRDIVQNVYIRYATDNVFYTAEANGVVGYPGHGNTNPNAFVGASNNSYLGYKRYVYGDIDFRYLQLKLEYINRNPTTSTLVLQGFEYEVDITEKRFSKIIAVNSVEGVYVDFSYINYVEVPKVSVTPYSTNSYVTAVSNISSNGCTIKVYDPQNGNAVDTENVSVQVLGI